MVSTKLFFMGLMLLALAYPGNAAITYFGENSDGTGEGTITGSTQYVYNGVTFTCPGTGNQVLKELAVRAYDSNGVEHVRLAIYNTAGTTKIAEGSAEVLFPTTAGWVGHGDGMSSTLSPSAPVLVGGTNYLIVFSSDGWNAKFRTYTPGSGTFYYVDTDYTGGFPATLSLTGADAYAGICVRAGVEPEAAPPASSIPSRQRSRSR